MGAQEHGRRSDLGLRLIAVGKLIKVVVLVALGIAALVAVRGDPPQLLLDAANVVGADPSGRHLHHLLEKLSGVSAKQLEAVGVGSFLYAAMFAVEGTGLWLQKKWAEYLTVGITTSFIPLELYEIAKHHSALRIVALLLNVAAVAYLVVRIMLDRRAASYSSMRSSM